MESIVDSEAMNTTLFVVQTTVVKTCKGILYTKPIKIPSQKEYSSSEEMLGLKIKTELIIENSYMDTHICETERVDQLPVFTTADVVGGEENDFIDECFTTLIKSEHNERKDEHVEADLDIKRAEVCSRQTPSTRLKKLKALSEDVKITSKNSYTHTENVNEFVASLNEESSDFREWPTSKRRRFMKQNSNIHKKIIKCNQCDRKFIKQFLYEAHVQSEHEGIEKPFQCTLCDTNFRMYYYLRRHLRETHATAITSESIGNHSKKKSSNIIQNECKICFKVFKRKEHLKDHHQSVHLGTRAFKCTSCEKRFATRKTCRVHEMGHSGERPFICDKCEKAFRQKSELKIHLEIHTENKDLLCTICKRMKRSREELSAHIECHIAAQQHQCPKCGRIFKKMSHLNEHDRAVHLKLRPYKCSYCKMSFALAKTCRTHERTHTGERPEVCSVCGQAFKQKSVLSNHMKRYHTHEQKRNSLNY